MPKRKTSTSFGEKFGNRRGKGPPKGQGGRPTKALKFFLADIRNSAKAQKALREAAEDSDSRNFATAWKLLADYDDEKPAEKRQIVGPVEVHVKVVREGRRVTAS